VNTLPLYPILFWEKTTGPLESSLIHMEKIIRIMIKIGKRRITIIKSVNLLIYSYVIDGIRDPNSFSER
jgi:hypothetical protein